jgi:hypothetical protein
MIRTVKVGFVIELLVAQLKMKKGAVRLRLIISRAQK